MNDPHPVMIDTSAFLAIISAEDRFHNSAAETFEALLRARRRLWVTSYVLVEFGAIVHKRLGFGVLNAFHERTQDSVQTLWIDKLRHEGAWKSLHESGGQGLNLVDRTVLLGARELDADVFTYDRGFRNQGLRLMPEFMR